VPTIVTGKMSISAIYKGWKESIKSNTINITVNPLKIKEKEQKFLYCNMILEWEKRREELLIKLFPEHAPNSVCHFVNLVKKGFYDGLKIFRIIRNSWIQAGCPYNLGVGNPGLAIKNEASRQNEKEIFHDLGTLSFSSQKLGYCGSQFFICLEKIKRFNRKFPIIGKIEGKGLDIIKELGEMEVDKDTDRPKKSITIKRMRIITK
jgi:peptidyl-prolyl cis-trans isomerase B (cyclophilin B)